MVSNRCRVRLLRQVLLYVIILFGSIVIWMTSRRYPLLDKFDHSTNKIPVANLTNNIISDKLGTLKYTIVRDSNPMALTDYFNPREEIVNPLPNKYVIKPKNMCDDPPFLVIIVCSIHSHTNVRDAIRDTWGSVGHGSAWPGSDVRLPVKILFLFGKVKMPSMEYLIKRESKTYNDVLQGDFTDSYKNLTLKTLMGLHFVAKACPAAEYVLKADEDTFTHVQLLYQFLRTVHPVNSVIGHIYTASPVRRYGVWAVSFEMYPYHDYPYYASGTTYVLSRDLIECITNTSSYLPYLPIEDVFVTGVMGVVCRATLVDVEGFTYWLQRAPDPEEFTIGNKLSGNKVSPGLAREIWKELIDFDAKPAYLNVSSV
ncbi:beta-1,3-galactosyltransferase 1-like [Haliotis rubra]|uniref:beta-1,3-galactosyltransferase 1-like n=1 Tax=Haliotis rubra TaxID=36100 RepID=UPI001EE50315|nr:beta-1,3-galactosyltransferase 1-like [Haliotis rubra]